jgi:hypothetical protein
MKRITWFLSFSFACVLGAACAEDPSVICDVVWSANGMEVGSGTITYDNLENVDAAVDMCLEDQADHEDRPAEATNYNCNCSTD